jgi:hypothetical protein
MNRKKDLEKISETYNLVNEIGVSAGSSTDGAPSDIVPTILKKKPCKCGEEGCEEPASNGGDSEVDMAKSEVYQIHKLSKELHEIIKDMPSMEPWVFSKITLASDYLNSVKGYLEYSKFKDSGMFDGEKTDHEYNVVSKIRDMLYGESKEVLESVMRQTIFLLEANKTAKTLK